MKNIRHIVIYPDNSSCIDGKFQSRARTTELLDQLGIAVEREAHTDRDCDQGERIVRGKTLVIAFPSAIGKKRLPISRETIIARSRRLEEQRIALCEEYRTLRASGQPHSVIVEHLHQKWDYAPLYINRMIARMARGKAA
jgi:hypothetical protein